MADVGIGCILVRCVVDVALAVWQMPTGSAGGDISRPTHSSSAACVWLGSSSIVGLPHRSPRHHHLWVQLREGALSSEPEIASDTLVRLSISADLTISKGS